MWDLFEPNINKLFSRFISFLPRIERTLMAAIYISRAIYLDILHKASREAEIAQTKKKKKLQMTSEKAKET